MYGTMVDTPSDRQQTLSTARNPTGIGADGQLTDFSADALGLLRFIEQEAYTSVMELQHYSGLPHEEIKSSLSELEEAGLVQIKSGNSVDLVIHTGSLES